MKAISIEEKEVEAYDEIAVIKRIVPKGIKVLQTHLQHLSIGQYNFISSILNRELSTMPTFCWQQTAAHSLTLVFIQNC